MILVNWGSTSFRAYRLDAQYKQMEERSSARGASTVIPGNFESALKFQMPDWIAEGEKRVLMSGMVGSQYGWKETPYVSLPADINSICDGVISFEAGALRLHIVPGLIGCDTSGVPEVMRGEETELLGCFGRPSGSTVVLPGTHTKWVELRDSNIVAFTTHMTGEFFHAVRNATILGRTIQGDEDDSRFEDGVTRTADPGGLLHHLFGVRAMILTGALTEQTSSAYISGLLIGYELRNAAVRDTHVHLVGNKRLCGLYLRAASSMGISATIEPDGAALRGLTEIAKRLSWI